MSSTDYPGKSRAQWHDLIARYRKDIDRALKGNFGLKPDAVHEYALKQAAAELCEIMEVSPEEALTLMCRIPMDLSVARIILPHITICETYFFRHPEHYKWLKEVFLPELVRRKTEQGLDKSFRCWSAACSTGEEAYSLAIAAREFFGPHSEWHIEIVATDINPASLEFARRAVYGNWSFRGVPQEIIEGHFVPVPMADAVPGIPRHQHYRVSESISALVTFAELNLNAQSWEGTILEQRKFDLIFCRNVLLYFYQEQISALAEKLVQTLEPHGRLVVSPSEVWLLNGSKFSALNYEGATVFALKEYVPQSEEVQRTQTPHGRSENRPSRSLPGTRKSSPSPLLRAHTFADPAGMTGMPIPHRSADRTAGKNLAEASEPAKIPPETLDPQQSAFSREEKRAQARALADSGRYREALEILDYLIEKDKTASELYYLRAVAYFGAHEFDLAAADLKRVLFLEPEHILAYIALASIEKERKNYREMRRLYSNALMFLSKIEETDIVPGSEGIPAGIMKNMITSLMENAGNE